MKISSSIRVLYNQQFDINNQLQKRVQEFLGDGKNGRWFYTSRVKGLESFTQKIETGRFIPHALEDFFACTLVVENKLAIEEAQKWIENFCTVISQKPLTNSETHKFPDAFPFDDLRLYVKLTPSDRTPISDLTDLIFEIQIKTFLQYAWSIATHDLIYKGNSISWSKARLAFQIKAMLEHAEISIEQVNVIASSTSLAMADKRTKLLTEILDWLQTTWPKDQLPNDIVRLSQTVSDLLDGLKLSLDDMKLSLSKDTALGLGTKLQNLSPYEIIIKSISNHNINKLNDFLKSSSNKRFKLLITPEMEINDLIKGADKNRMVFSTSPS